MQEAEPQQDPIRPLAKNLIAIPLLVINKKKKKKTVINFLKLCPQFLKNLVNMKYKNMGITEFLKNSF